MIERMVAESVRQQIEKSTARDETTERVIEIFDATQPTDSLTGTPPLQSRVTERSQSKESSDSRTETESSVTGTEAQAQTQDTAVAREVVTSESEEDREAIETESREERKGNTTLTMLQVGADIMIAIFMLWLLLTVGKAIKPTTKT